MTIPIYDDHTNLWWSYHFMMIIPFHDDHTSSWWIIPISLKSYQFNGESYQFVVMSIMRCTDLMVSHTHFMMSCTEFHDESYPLHDKLYALGHEAVADSCYHVTEVWTLGADCACVKKCFLPEEVQGCSLNWPSLIMHVMSTKIDYLWQATGGWRVYGSSHLRVAGF